MQRFSVMFWNACYWSLTWAKLLQSPSPLPPYFVWSINYEAPHCVASSSLPALNSLLHTSVLLNSLFMNTLTLWPYLNVKAYPLQTTDKITVFHILIFMLLGIIWNKIKFWTEWQQAFLKFSLLLIYLWIQFWFVSIITGYLIIATYSGDSLAVFI
jgi:hypothetical protein